MEQTLPPLVSDERIESMRIVNYPTKVAAGYNYSRGCLDTRDIYEADRAKTREVVQALVSRLVQQADLCKFTDDHGHDLRMNAAYLDLITFNTQTP